MDDMQFAKYSDIINMVLDNTTPEGLENLVRNTVAHVISENNNSVNWLAHEIFADVINNDCIIQIFDD